MIEGMECLGGEDATLQYYYHCRSCGTIVKEDCSSRECLKSWKCPVCSPSNQFPFVYFTKEDLDMDRRARGKMIGVWIAILRSAEPVQRPCKEGAKCRVMHTP